MNILILDDEPKIRNGLLKLISESCHNKHTVHPYGDPQLAFEFLKTHPVDLVITDIRMPAMSGLTMLQDLQALGRRFEVVILSGYSDFTYAQKAIELSVKKYITKPSDPREIIEVIDEIEKSLERSDDMLRPLYHGSNLTISKCVDYIGRNYPSKFTLDDMAAELYISPTYLCRLFKKETGWNLSEFITHYRIEKAKGYLGQIELSINQIAAMVGYKDTNYFSSIFKKLVGKTPHDYRNSQADA